MFFYIYNLVVFYQIWHRPPSKDYQIGHYGHSDLHDLGKSKR